MSNEKDLNKQMFSKAEEELQKEKVEMVKGFILDTLKRLEFKKSQKEGIEEEIRILKMDLDDLRAGNFEKIKERINHSATAKQISVYPNLVDVSEKNWPSLTGGTYNTGFKIYYY
jgi:hypothetical protein